MAGFKKFSDIKKSSKKIEEITPQVDREIDNSGTPNLSNRLDNSKSIETIVDNKLKPFNQSINHTDDDGKINTLKDYQTNIDNPEIKPDFSAKKTNTNTTNTNTNETVKTYGKVAKFPKDVKASKAYNFLENVKVSKKNIWYIMVEKQDDQLQMVKYNYDEGVDLVKFTNELKSYYKFKYRNNSKICEMIENIQIDGNDKYSWVKNIPNIKVEDDKKMITKITEDLIQLLSK